ERGWHRTRGADCRSGRIRPTVLGLVVRWQVFAGAERSRSVARVFAGSPGEAISTSEVERAERAIFPRWKMGGIRLERNGELGNLRFAISECERQMASI